MSEEELNEKYEKLKAYLASFGKVAVAYSSGVDSTFLLQAAIEALGPKNVIALTAASHSFPKKELREASTYCQIVGVPHFIVEANELEIEGFAENPPERCYICKKDLFSRFIARAEELGISELVEGSNLDDEGDYRPGMRAIEELGVKSPLRTFAFTKSEIRQMSKKLSLPTWDKQSYACLSSRIPYGETITAEKLKMVEAAEELLSQMGFAQYRVRIHGTLARIELLPEDFPKMMEEKNRLLVENKLHDLGFSYVALDLRGFRSGSMNEVLSKA